MKKIKLTFFGAFLFLAIFSQIVSAETVNIGKYEIAYDEVVEADTDGDGVNDRWSYYKNDTLVFTAYDTDQDGKHDLWFRYNKDWYLDLEITDNDGDGKPDEFLHLNRDEVVTKVEKAEGILEQVFQMLQNFKDRYNENADKVPGILKRIFGSERMNIYIGEGVIGVVTQDGRIMDLKKSEVSDPTLKVTVKEDLIKSLLASEDPGTDFLDAFNRGEISYEAYSTSKKIKLIFVKVAAKLLSFFS